MGIKTENEEAFKKIKSKLSKSKFKFSDLTKNQISNDHLRHMVGGHKSIISERDSERLYRCQFPVRPGALMGFLKDFGSKWKHWDINLRIEESIAINLPLHQPLPRRYQKRHPYGTMDVSR